MSEPKRRRKEWFKKKKRCQEKVWVERVELRPPKKE